MVKYGHTLQLCTRSECLWSPKKHRNIYHSDDMPRQELTVEGKDTYSYIGQYQLQFVMYNLIYIYFCSSLSPTLFSLCYSLPGPLLTVPESGSSSPSMPRTESQLDLTGSMEHVDSPDDTSTSNKDSLRKAILTKSVSSIG